MARGFKYSRGTLNVSPTAPTGGPTSNAGQMADAGTLTENFGTIRSKTSGINEIPIDGMKQQGEREQMEMWRDYMTTKAENDADVITAKYDAQVARNEAAQSSASTTGAARFGMGILGAGLKMFTGGLA